MKNILQLIKEGAKTLYYIININVKKIIQRLIPDKVYGKQDKPMKKSSALVAASMGRSAVQAVRRHSSKFV